MHTYFNSLIARRPPLSEAVLILTPYIWGAILYPYHLAAVEPEQYLMRIGWCWVLFASWAAMRAYVLHEQRMARARSSERKPTRPSKRESLKRLSLLVAVSVPLLGSLQPFKNLFGETLFYVALVIMMWGALADALAFRQKTTGAIFAYFLANTGVAYLTFQCGEPPSSWQPLGLSMSIGALHASWLAAKFLAKAPEMSAVALRARYIRTSRLFAMFMMLAPMPFGLLVLSRQEHQLFILPALLYVFIVPLLSQVKRGEEGAAAPPELVTKTLHLALLLVAIVIAVAVFALF